MLSFVGDNMHLPVDVALPKVLLNVYHVDTSLCGEIFEVHYYSASTKDVLTCLEAPLNYGSIPIPLCQPKQACVSHCMWCGDFHWWSLKQIYGHCEAGKMSGHLHKLLKIQAFVPKKWATQHTWFPSKHSIVTLMGKMLSILKDKLFITMEDFTYFPSPGPIHGTCFLIRNGHKYLHDESAHLLKKSMD